MERYRDPTPDRIVTNDRKLKESIRRKFIELYLEGKKVQLEERSKTPEEEELVKQLDSLIGREIEKMGGQVKLFPLDKVRFYTPQSKIELEDWEDETMGKTIPLLQEIEIIADENDFQTILSVLVHELIHMHQFTSVVTEVSDKDDSIKIRPRRIGLEFIGDSEDNKLFRSFRYLNEALTELLTSIFLKNNSTKIKALKDFSYEDHFSEAYVEEKLMATALIASLKDMNPDVFSKYIEVANMLFRSMFTGQTLELARIIEKTFGEGSFRELGERFSKKPVVIDDILARGHKKQNQK